MKVALSKQNSLLIRNNLHYGCNHLYDKTFADSASVVLFVKCFAIDSEDFLQKMGNFTVPMLCMYAP